MAILNYADTLKEVKGYLSLAESNSGDYVKLIFTKDGHIITHGLDYTKDYNGTRGLVPNYSSSLGDTGVLSKDGWADILSVLPIADEITGGDTTHIPTNDQLVKYIGTSIRAAETLRFMGGIGYEGSNYYHIPVNGQRQEGFPKNCKVGDSYRIINNGVTIAGNNDCQAGDMIVCIKNNPDGETGSEFWLVIQANIEGTSEVTINGTTYHIYTSAVIGKTNIYAPTTAGSNGNILVSNGSSPIWGTLAISDKGVLTVTSNNTAYINQNLIAYKTQKSLKPGIGFNGNTEFDGSIETTWNLNKASRDSLGGVLIDNKKGNFGENKSTISVDSNGRIFLDQDNIANALGYNPASAYNLILGSSDSASTNITDNTTNPFINLVGANTTSIQILGSGKLSVVGGITNNKPKITVSLGIASISDIGGVKVAKTNNHIVTTNTSNIQGDISAGKYYGLEVDKNGKAFVYVPWIDGIVNSSSKGLAPQLAKEDGSLNSNSCILASIDGSAEPKWYQIPFNAFNNTWREIKVGNTSILGTDTNTGAVTFVGSGKTSITGADGTISINSTWRDITINNNSIGDSTLNFVPTGDIYVKADNNNNDIVDLSFGLSWYNISTNAYEYDSAVYN